MKTLYILLVFIVSTVASFAQPYVPMLGEVNEWYQYKFFEFNYSTFITKTTGDTIIGGLLYKKADEVSGNNYSYYAGFLREDTTARKIYFTRLYFLNQSDSNPQLLYDFSKQTGDTLEICQGISSIHSLLKAVIDTILVDTAISPNRMFRLHTIENYSQKLEWIEGIGSRAGVFHNTKRWNRSNPYDIDEILLCAFRDSIQAFHYYITFLSGQPDTCILNSPSALNEIAVNNLTISPNPSGSFISFKADEGGKDARLIIYNAHGLAVLQQNNPEKTIFVGTLPPGLYLMKYQTGQKISTGRFIKQ